MIREVRGPEPFVSLSFKFILPFVRFALVNRPFSFLFRFPILEETTVFRMRLAPSSSVTGAHAWRIHGKVLRRYSGRLISLAESSPFDCAALFLRSLPFRPLALPVSSRFYSRFSRFPFLPDRPFESFALRTIRKALYHRVYADPLSLDFDPFFRKLLVSPFTTNDIDAVEKECLYLVSLAKRFYSLGTRTSDRCALLFVRRSM